ncbi:phenazine biosynthesis protein PhzF family [Desulfosporosinus hippei DSM 8344]|uniref:Phenazine biosynthesis protein PhzF family n=1 Tax=Desulfosporosinus hippei DSM 8344 TaxID=1121419 RepID=A0A1G8BGV9_9FIRM|nr:phenazine biosynthesis protein PhzF family [Desulfosporosinus hippei DSM 8344]
MKIFQVDAFTNEAFNGNPAGVCILDNLKSDSWMQSFANEMNLSETAFLFRENKVFNLRWFTPKTEVSLCGHATLASAHILWEEKILKDNQEAIFSTKSGLL